MTLSTDRDQVIKAKEAAEQFVMGSQSFLTRKHAADNVFSAGKKGRQTREESEKEVSRQPAVPLQRKRQDTFPEVEWWDMPLIEKMTPLDLSETKARHPDEDIWPYRLKEVSMYISMYNSMCVCHQSSRVIITAHRFFYFYDSDIAHASD